jgi:hypothetical protein
MNRATPTEQDLTARLIALETKRGKHPRDQNPPAFLICGKMRLHLATLMGFAGFRALLDRALALATADTPWLSAVQVQADGTLAWKETIRPPVVAKESEEGTARIVVYLLGLLTAFIGEGLTLQMMSEIWPGLNRPGSRVRKGK